MTLNKALTTAIRTAAELGVELPTEFLEANNRLAALHHRANEPEPRQSLADAFAEAFDADRDPFTDKAVKAARTPPLPAEPMRITIRNHASRLLDQHAVDILTAFTPTVAANAAVLVSILDTAGPLSLTSNHPRADEARTANDNIEKVRRVWAAFKTAGAAGFNTRHVHDLHVIAEADPDLWWRTAIGSSANPDRPDAWAATIVGFTITLAPNPDTVWERAATVEAAREETLRRIDIEHRTPHEDHNAHRSGIVRVRGNEMSAL